MALQHPNSDPQDEARSTIPQVVRMLLTARGREQRDLARYMRLTESQLSDRLARRTSFKAQEIAAIAAFLEVDPGVLYKSPGELVSRFGYKPDSASWTPRVVPEAGQGVLALGAEAPRLRPL